MGEIVGLPCYLDLENMPLPVSDYARDKGAKLVNANFGEVWLRSVSRKGKGMETYRWDGKDSRRGAETVDTDNVGLAPQFDDCYEISMAPRWNAADKSYYLTIKDKLVYYPQTRVDDKLANRLNVARTKCNSEMGLVGIFTRPLRYDPHQQAMHVGLDACYTFEGQCYVHCDDDRPAWYRCEPVKVLPLSFGRIQCATVLTTAPVDCADNFIPNGRYSVNNSMLMRYLNKSFLNDLTFSTSLKENIQNSQKLTHKIANFVSKALKRGTDNEYGK